MNINKDQLKDAIFLSIVIDDNSEFIANSIMINDESIPKIPANGHFGFKFNESTTLIFNDDLMEVTSVILVPDQFIKKSVSDKLANTFVTFSKETIQEIRPLLINNKLININHNKDTISSDNSELVELFTHDSNKQISTLYSELVDGTLIGTYKIKDADLWQRIKNSNEIGFSIELKSGVRLMTEDEVNEILDKDTFQDDIYDMLLELGKSVKSPKEYLKFIELINKL